MPTAVFQTPLVERTLKAQNRLQVGDDALRWCGINVVLCVVFALQLVVLFISTLTYLPYPYLTYAQYLEISLSVVCGISAVCDLITYLNSRKFKDHLLALSPTQSILLNIKNLTSNTKLVDDDHLNNNNNNSMHSPHKSARGVSGDTSSNSTFFHNLTADLNTSGVTGNTTTTTTIPARLNGSMRSLTSTSSPAGHRCNSAPVTPHVVRRSRIFEPYTPATVSNVSLHVNVSSNSLSHSFHSNNNNNSFCSLPSINTSNISFTTPIRECDSSLGVSPSPKIRKTVTDLNNLKEYLKEYEEKEKWLSRGQNDRSVAGGWTPRHTETLLPRPYYLATQNQIVSVSGDTSYYNQQAADSLLDRLDISQHDLDVWTENIRKWVSQTIFKHLVQEIETINSVLEQLGSTECKVGSVSTAVLSKISANKQEHMPNIALLVPYLEVCVNQVYLTQRIMALAEGSCLGCYRWDSGGCNKGSEWNKELPTDAQIVFHCVATYLDSHLPRNPMYPEGRTFSTQYFLQTPSKVENKKKEYALFQSSIHPPHFKILLANDEVWEVNRGRNNLFHVLILFLYYLKTDHHGMLGPVNLGPTGLNMLWIINNR